LQVQLKAFPDGEARPEHFDLVQTELPPLDEGEVLCANRYLSLDPYMRSQIAGRHTSGALALGDVMRGECVSEVIESRHVSVPVGTLVRCMGGWQTHSIQSAAAVQPIAKSLSKPSYALSVLGMPGLTAYAGLHILAQAKAGDVVLVPAATGAVGGTVGQLAKLAGCTVIGIAGSADKCRYARETLAYDACINRREGDLREQLDALAPNGVDIYFDLVGGEFLQIASERLAVGARVILCGLMAEYNSTTRAGGPPPGLWIKARAAVYGLVVYDFEQQRDEFISKYLPLVESGALTVQEDIALGLEQAPEAFGRLMRGENQGKALVKL